MTAIKYTLVDKLAITTILPEKGSILTKVLCRDIKAKVELTADETKESGLTEVENGVSFSKNIDVKLDFTDDEINLLKKSAVEADRKGLITDQNLELVEKLLK